MDVFAYELQLFAFQLSALAEQEHSIGDRAIFPDNMLHTLLKSKAMNELEGRPMVFAVESGGVQRFVSVESFTAGDGTCYLPDDVMRQLDVRNGELVTVKYTNVPKCTEITLRVSREAHEILSMFDDPCAILESSLRQYTCLQQDTTIELDLVGQRASFDVMCVEPLFCSLVIDTDVELTLERPVDSPRMEADVIAKESETVESSSSDVHIETKEDKTPQEPARPGVALGGSRTRSRLIE